MALKDLPGSVVLDFKILLDQLKNYINDVAENKAGTRLDRNRVPKGSKLEIRYPSGNPTALMTALYGTLKANIKVESSTVATFDSKYKDIATWSNNFFILRTKVVGVVPGNDPVLKAFDDTWTALEAITARWNISRTR
jgi:hypothetical protein